jgi:hypothetical protein
VKVNWVGAGVEIAADRRCTWVAFAGVSKLTRRVTVELQEPLDGTQVTAALLAMWEHAGLEWFALDPRSPSSTLIEPLQAESMPLKLADTIGVATAHGRFADLLYADRLRLRGHRALDQAMQTAESRRLAGSVAIDRYAAADMAPLMAAELSVWALGDPETADGIEAGVWVLDAPGPRDIGRAGWTDGIPAVDSARLRQDGDHA